MVMNIKPTHYCQHGYTLLELLVTLTVLGILTALAVPYYFEYISKMQAKEGQNMVLLGGGNISAMIKQKSCLPDGKPQIFEGRYGILTTIGVYQARKGQTCRTGCQITYTFNADSNAELRNQTISGEILANGQVSRIVSDTSLSSDYLTENFKVIPQNASESCPLITDLVEADLTDTAGQTQPAPAAKTPPSISYHGAVQIDPNRDPGMGYVANVIFYETAAPPVLIDLNQPFSIVTQMNPNRLMFPDRNGTDPRVLNYYDSRFPPLADARQQVVHVINDGGYYRDLPGRWGLASRAYTSDNQMVLPNRLEEFIYTSATENKANKQVTLSFLSLPDVVYQNYRSITVSLLRPTNFNTPVYTLTLNRNTVMRSRDIAPYQLTFPIDATVTYPQAGCFRDRLMLWGCPDVGYIYSNNYMDKVGYARLTFNK